MSKQPRFIVMTAYAVKASAVTLYYAMQEVMRAWPGQVEAGEVVLVDQSAGGCSLPRSLHVGVPSKEKKDDE